MSEKPQQKSASQNVSTLGGFLAGGFAACGAVTVTNPIEVVKTRMQLQGELAHTSNAPKPYKNPIQALGVIFKNEGIRGLQRGLVCAYIYQIGLNGCRLGLYEPCRNVFNSLFYPNVDPHQIQNIPINILSGTLSGVAGAIVGSPLYLVKTRMQSYSPFLQIGQQTHYTSMWDGLRSIVRSEGWKGLTRGVDAAIFRTGCGSAVQLPIYTYTKTLLKDWGLTEGPALHLLSSTMSGIGVGIVMNPGDVLLTRVYNQKGNLYKGPVDCLVQTVKAEGFLALYKGFGAQLLRIAPHTILTLTFMEQTMKFVQYAESRF